MKLLRLTSNNNKGIIETNFNQDIEINKDSQIALLNTSFSVDKKEFTVDNFNNEIVYEDSATTRSTAVLQLKTYTKADSGELLEDIKLKLNSSMIDSQQNIGSQFGVNVEGGSTVIQNKICPNNGDLFDNYTKGKLGKRTDNINVTNNNTRLAINSSVATNNDSEYITSYAPMGKGNTSFRCRVERLLTNPGFTDENGFILALSTVHPQNFTFTGDILDQRDDLYYIQVNDLSNATNIQYKVKDGTPQDSLLQLTKTGTTATANVNYFQIDISQGKIKGKFFNVANENELFNVPYDGKTPLYPLLIMRGDSSKLRLNTIKFFLDPFKNNFDRYLNPVLEENDNLLGASPITVRHRSTVKKIIFERDDLPLVLGFDGLNLANESNIRGQFKNTSNNIYDLDRANPYFLITSKNIELDTFDGDTKGRQNILYSFGDNTENSNGSVFFSPNTPVFLDIKNSTARSIRNLRFEIKNADNTQVNTDGKISLSILIK